MVMGTVFRAKKLKATPKTLYNKKIIIKRKSLIIYTVQQKWTKTKDKSSTFQTHKAISYTLMSPTNRPWHILQTLPINRIYWMGKKAILIETEFIIHNSLMIVKNTFPNPIPYPILKTVIKRELHLYMFFPKKNLNPNGFFKKK